MLKNAPLAGPTAVVVGMGALGMVAARQLSHGGVPRIIVTNRELAKAKALLLAALAK